jgi:hypothetical protein
VQSLSTSNFYTTASPGGVAGDAAGFWVQVLFTVDSQAVASASRMLTARFSTNGYQLFTTTTNAGLLFQVADGGSVTRSSPSYTIQASDVGKVLHAVGVFDNTNNKVRLYVNRAEVSAGNACTGYTAFSGAQFIGKRSAGTPADNCTIFGAGGGAGIPSLAEIQALADAIKAGRDIQAITGKTDHLWSVTRDVAAGAVPTTITDRSGSDTQTKNGSPTLVTVANPTWGW